MRSRLQPWHLWLFFCGLSLLACAEAQGLDWRMAASGAAVLILVVQWIAFRGQP